MTIFNCSEGALDLGWSINFRRRSNLEIDLARHECVNAAFHLVKTGPLPSPFPLPLTLTLRDASHRAADGAVALAVKRRLRILLQYSEI